MFVVLYSSPSSETLLRVNYERLFLYSIIFGVCFLLAGEVTGLFVMSNGQKLLWKRLVLALLSSVVGSLGLLLSVWIVEFDFVGRFAVFKMVCGNGFLSYAFISFQIALSSRNPWRVLPLFDEVRSKQIKTYLGPNAEGIDWVDVKKTPLSECATVDYCDQQGVEMIVLDQNAEAKIKGEIMDLLASGVRILEVESFVETLCQKIPPTEVDSTWLTKLDLRQRDPIVRRIKRLLDLFLSVVGLIICMPILLISCFIIGLESGFPLFFHQKRTGLLGQPYVLHKLRTMRQNAEEKGAEWAKQNDSRVTIVGRFLRKWRIDEIPQFWNVIKGEMSIVGPRPERPELENEINERLPYWKCRYLLKPGLTGWAQIRFRYASDMESSEEKLSYDLYYVKNASFFLDLEIMLSTLRSLTKGSR
jgi:lipopolysaccharide/colanic/teichoic acid biosynthesis glycosyltransferase